MLLAKQALACNPSAGYLCISRRERSEKLMRSSEKLIFRAIEIGRIMKVGSEGKGLSYQPQALENHINGE